MSVLTADSRRDLEIHRYPVLIYGLVPLVALVLQAWLPRLVGKYAWFDLPLVVTVYFALGRRSPIQGTIMGCAVGLFEDALTHHAIGINGIAKTICGFMAASVGIRIDVENKIIRVGLIFLLSLLSSALYIDANAYRRRHETANRFGNAVDADGVVGERIFKQTHSAAHDRALDRASAAQRKVDGDYEREIEPRVFANEAWQPGLQHQRHERNQSINQDRVSVDFKIAAGIRR